MVHQPFRARPAYRNPKSHVSGNCTAKFLYDKFPGPDCMEEAGLNSLSNKNCAAKFKWLRLPAGASTENNLSPLGFCTLGLFMIGFQPA